MDSPKLDREITLERFTATQDEGSGEDIQVWAPIATVWASKRDISDGEKFAASEVVAEMSTRFQIRWDQSWSDLNPKDRVVYEGRIYGIVGVKELGRRDGLEITAAARADA